MANMNGMFLMLTPTSQKEFASLQRILFSAQVTVIALTNCSIDEAIGAVNQVIQVF